MPLYEYICVPCNRYDVQMRLVAERHDGPECFGCKQKMDLILSPTRGVVKSPAVPRSPK